MNSTVSIFTEIPETLHESLKNYLESHPDWDQNRVLTAALSLFLLQNGDSDRRAARVYLETFRTDCHKQLMYQTFSSAGTHGTIPTSSPST
jgi:hypothetical protein